MRDVTGAEYAIHEADAAPAKTLMLGGITGLMPGAQGAPKPDRLPQDGDLLELGALQFRVLHTPGHTPGGISLFGNGVVFTGDTLFNSGIGRTDLPGGDYQQLMNSIRTKLMVLPDSTIVYPGHGPETTIGAEVKANPYLS